MKEFFKKNVMVILAFALPMALIAGVAFFAYAPSLFFSPTYDFLYATCDNGASYHTYNCNEYLQKRFSVENGNLVENYVNPEVDLNNDGKSDGGETYKARIFLYNAAKNESREIKIEDIKKISLSDLLTSPEGVTVSNQYDRGADFFPIFGGSSSYGYYFIKGSSRKKINIINNDGGYYYRGNFQLIGWVLK